MKVTVIGDVHGKLSEYKTLLRNFQEPTIQLGDMGIGFRGKGGNFLTLRDLDPKDKWFHGNHDDPQRCVNEPGYMGRYGVTEEGIFFVAGAFSVDAFYRTVGIDWWHDEQLSMEEFAAAEELYIKTKPSVVVTHDCPRSLYPFMLNVRNNGKHAPIFENTTTHFLEKLLNIHRPNVWVFGHWHRSVDRVMDGIRFICLDELEAVTLEF